MTDKQIIKLRPICLHEDTCLHLKEKTRLCEDCVHHKNYWSELLEKEQLEKIKSLKQECEKLKKQHESDKGLITSAGKMNYQLLQEYDKLKAENEELRNFHINLVGVKECDIRELLKLKQTLTEIKKIAEYCYDLVDKENDGFWSILQKISECEVGNEHS